MSSLGENDFWRGAFIKHYRHKKKKNERHPEELPEHIYIIDVTQLTDDEIDEHDENLENDLPIEDLSQIGDGDIPWLVTMSFVADGTPYEFVVYSDEEPDSDSLRNMLADYFTPQ